MDNITYESKSPLPIALVITVKYFDQNTIFLPFEKRLHCPGSMLQSPILQLIILLLKDNFKTYVF